MGFAMGCMSQILRGRRGRLHKGKGLQGFFSYYE
jgi:hypothetical protein